MKKIVFNFLNTKYPKLHKKPEPFGMLIQGYEKGRWWYEIYFELIADIMLYFNVDVKTSQNLLDDWVRNLPVISSQPN